MWPASGSSSCTPSTIRGAESVGSGLPLDTTGARSFSVLASMAHRAGLSCRAMASRHISETPATTALRAAKVAFTAHPYDYVDHGGTAESAQQLGLDEHAVIKTLVMQDESARPLIVLMHGDRKVSTKNLARQAARKTITPCEPEVAQRHTGYQVGGTSPFGVRKRMPVFVERTVLDLPRIWINGGRRGFLVGLEPAVLTEVLQASAVDCALED